MRSLALAACVGWIVWCLCQPMWAEDVRQGTTTYELPEMIVTP